MNEISLYTLAITILASTLRMSTPFLFASMGELFAEKSGVLNLSIEGMMVVGAFFSFVTVYFTGNPWVGVSVAILSGGMAALTFSVLTILLRTNQIVTGIAMNLLTMGITTYLYRVIFGISKAHTPFVKEAFLPLKIPGFSTIPFIGEIFFSQYLMVYIALLLVPILSIVMYRTTFGLSVIALGENPTAADTRGISVSRVRLLTTVFGGCMAGVAGSFLVIATMNEFTPGVVAGRGWISIVLVIFGKWTVLPVVNRIPYQFFIMLPYLCTIIVLFSARRLRYGNMPTYLAVAYKRGG
jgi:simple sugar transport system permease protein